MDAVEEYIHFYNHERPHQRLGLLTPVQAVFIAGICATGLVTILFSTAYKELSAKRNGLNDLEAQLRLHELLSAQAGDGADARSAANMLETSRMLCCKAAKGYNRILSKSMNLPAARLRLVLPM